MRFRLKAAAAAVAAVSILGVCVHATGQASSTKAPSTKASSAKTKKAKTPPPPSVQDQIEELRKQMQSQIDSLRNDLTQKDAQLRQAQQSATDAQAAAAKAQAAADAQQAAFTQNQAAVSTLQATVDDVKNANALAVGDLSDQTAAIRKSIATPEGINYKGVLISPAGSFLELATVWRNRATGGDINTPLTGIPLDNAQGAQLSEFFVSARQSRIALKATGKFGFVTASGYYEADFLSSGTTSNANQSNSYTLRERELWGDAKLDNGWDFSGGTGWSLIAENGAGLARGTQVLPSTIDAQYTAGFVWAREPSFRITKNIGRKWFAGASFENAQILNPSGQNLPTNYLFGATGTNGGLYNTTANYSFNYSPDFIVKLAAEPGWGHWELFGVERNFRSRVYPAITTSAGAYNDLQIGAGIGGSVRGLLDKKRVTLGLKGLWGQGVGRFGSSTIADVTVRPSGQMSPLHGFSALSTVELNPTPRFNAYFNYGADYIGRNYVLNGTTQVGYGTRSANMSGCLIEPGSPLPGATGADAIAPTNCTGSNKAVQEFTAGYWFNFFNNPHGRLRQGMTYELIRRDLWSGAGGTTNPSNGAHGTDNMIFTSFRYYLP